MTSPLLSQIREELAKLETARRQKGIVSPALVREVLPPHLAAAATPFDCRTIADRLNAALAEETAPVLDHQTRAAGEG